MSYTKLDSGLTDSTIWQAPDSTRIVWITLLSLADQNGYIGASMPGLAGRARVPLDACVKAIETLMAPDEWSRTKDHDGRRIAEADGGWVLLNHAKYRAKQTADDRRERSRIAMAELRAKRKREHTTGNSDPALTKLAERESKLSQAEAATDTEKTIAPSVLDQRFSEFWQAYPKKVGKDAARRAFAKRKVNAELLVQMIGAIKAQRSGEQWKRDGGQFIPNPATWLNEGRWQDETSAASSVDAVFGAGAI